MDYMAISEFFSLLGDSAKSEEFSQKAAKLKVYFLENKLQKIFVLLKVSWNIFKTDRGCVLITK